MRRFIIKPLHFTGFYKFPFIALNFIPRRVAEGAKDYTPCLYGRELPAEWQSLPRRF